MKARQHVPLDEYSENLKEIARHLATVGVASDRVVFITPPPLHEATWEKECLLKGTAVLNPKIRISLHLPFTFGHRTGAGLMWV